MNLLVVNGPNLNMLGIREPDIYGRTTYADLCAMIREHCDAFGIACELKQSNHEGDLVDMIQRIPAVEVHISDPDTREPFRKISYIRSACVKTIKGRGINGYLEAVDFLKGFLENESYYS